MTIAEKFTAGAAALQREVDEIRQQIAATRDEVDWIENAPLDREEVKQRVAAAVTRAGAAFLENARLGDVVHRGEIAELLEIQGRANLISDAAIAGLDIKLAPLLCWLMPDPVTQRICAAIDGGEIAFESGPPTAERPALIEAARERLFSLECDEEQLISDAEEAGIEIGRRADASPEVILDAHEVSLYRYKAVPKCGEFHSGEVESDEPLTRTEILQLAEQDLPAEWLAKHELEGIDILEPLDSDDVVPDGTEHLLRKSRPPRGSKQRRKRVFQSQDMRSRAAEKGAITKAINAKE